MQLLLDCLLPVIQMLDLMSKVIVYSCVIVDIEVNRTKTYLCEDLIIMDLIIQIDNFPS